MSFSTRLWWATTSTRSLFTLLRTRSLLSSLLMMLWSSSSLVAILSRRESFKWGIERAATDRWVLLLFVYFGDVVWIVVLFFWFNTNLIIRRVLRDGRIIEGLVWWQEEKGGIKTIYKRNHGKEKEIRGENGNFHDFDVLHSSKENFLLFARWVPNYLWKHTISHSTKRPTLPSSPFWVFLLFLMKFFISSCRYKRIDWEGWNRRDHKGHFACGPSTWEL